MTREEEQRDTWTRLINEALPRWTNTITTATGNFYAPRYATAPPPLPQIDFDHIDPLIDIDADQINATLYHTNPEATAPTPDFTIPAYVTDPTTHPSCTKRCPYKNDKGESCTNQCSNWADNSHRKCCCLPRTSYYDGHTARGCIGHPDHRSTRPAPSHANWVANPRVADPERP